mmetsp:Transcript_34881/g.76119  ORF Transcript_34881/g.76119 Transcript_34881/m.76119 type:complete len:274 (-) Transcript_34881:60-881(-)
MEPVESQGIVTLLSNVAKRLAPPGIIGSILGLLYWWLLFGTPLHRASWEGRAEDVAKLLDVGALTNVTVLTGDTPLHWAALGGHAAVAELLLQWGAEVAPTDVAGVVPLDWAADGGFLNVSKLLVAGGADVSRSTRMGATPLHRAARKGHAAVVQFLLDQGANPNATDVSWNTPRDLARHYMHQHVMDMLPDPWVPPSDENSTSAQEPDNVTAVAEGLIGSGYDDATRSTDSVGVSSTKVHDGTTEAPAEHPGPGAAQQAPAEGSLAHSELRI